MFVALCVVAVELAAACASVELFGCDCCRLCIGFVVCVGQLAHTRLLLLWWFAVFVVVVDVLVVVVLAVAVVVDSVDGSVGLRPFRLG